LLCFACRGCWRESERERERRIERDREREGERGREKARETERETERERNIGELAGERERGTKIPQTITHLGTHYSMMVALPVAVDMLIRRKVTSTRQGGTKERRQEWGKLTSL